MRIFLLVLLFIFPLTAFGVSSSTNIKLEVTGETLGGTVPSGYNYKYDYFFNPDLKILSISENSAVFSFHSSEYESAISIFYGESANNLSNIKESSKAKDHIIVLDNLKPGTKYYFLVEYRKPSGPSFSSIYSFQTLSKKYNIIPNVLNLEVLETEGAIRVSWENPSIDFKEIIVIKGVNKMITSLSEENVVYRGKGNFFIDYDIERGNRYYYTVFVVSHNNTLSSGAFVYFDYPEHDNKLELEKEEKPIFSVPTNTDVDIDVVIPKGDTSSKKVRDYFINYLDLIYFLPSGEVMLNDFDINKSGVTIIQNEPVRIIIDEKFIEHDKPDFALMLLGDRYYFLKYEDESKIYILDINLGRVGSFDAKIFLVYGGETIEKDFVINVIPYGRTYGVHNNTSYLLRGAQIELFRYNNTSGSWELWNGGSYGQVNPIISQDGKYVFLVGEGKYKIRASKPGYKKYEIEIINLGGYGILNSNIFMKENIITYIIKETQILFNWLRSYF